MTRRQIKTVCPFCQCGCGERVVNYRAKYKKGHSTIRDDESARRHFRETTGRNQNGCWIWMGSLTKPAKKGGEKYGSMTYKNKRELAHRISYLVFKGSYDKSLCVCHECDNPSCVNPDHLWLGTNEENIKDMWNKGRECRQYGEDASASKLTNRQVVEIRRLSSEGALRKDVAKMFGIAACTVSQIVHRRKWRTV